MLNFTIYTADCVGNSGNCLYTNKMIVTDKESFIKATKMDHVTAKYKGNYRSKDNFEYSDCIPLDCDNDHSDNPNEWVTPLDIALEIPGVAFAVSYSRHHNLPKGDKSARPRFHIFFPIEIVSDEQEYADMKRRIADAFPYYETNALDSARFLYGNDSAKVEFYEGDKTIVDFLEEDGFADFGASLEQVPEGQRNSAMSHIAGKIIKRYGNTEDAYQIFLKKAELCNPPLPESELKVIWRSASIKFGNKVSNQEGYIPPEQYNSDCRLKPDYHSGSAKTLKSIQITLAARLEKFNLESLAGLTATDELDLPSLGEKKVALFALIPDNDTSFIQIAAMKERLEGYRTDIQTYTAHKPVDKDTFSMKIGNRTYKDKKEAGAALIDMCRSAKQPNMAVTIGEYQGFKMSVSFDSFFSKFMINLKGSLSHEVEIGADPLGNLQRLSNALEGMTGKMADVEQKLSNVEHQLETAKVEVTKPFAQEQELAEKLDRLAELNVILNMDEKGDNALDMGDDEPEDEAGELSEQA